jgi:hypothetical protein
MPAIERVFTRHGAWHYDLGRDENGARRSKQLARFDEGEAAVYAALSKIISPKATTIADLLLAFRLSFEFRELAVRTRFDYGKYIEAALIPTFGHMSPGELTTAECAQWLRMEKMRGAGSQANKKMACLSSAFQFALGTGLAESNPCRGIRRNKTRARERYVRHDEFLLYFNAAPEHLQDIMAGIYLMELRPHEARDMLRTSITPQGIVNEGETKTNKLKVIGWSPALQFFLTRATSRFPSSPFVFTNSQGDKWTEGAMHSSLRAVRDTLPEGSPRWTFHDLRAKGESDHKDGGHGLLSLYKRAKFVTPVA